VPSVAAAWSVYVEGDHDGALEQLIEAWDDSRNPELAEVIEAFIASQPREPLKARTRAKRRREWEALADEADPLDVPRLFDALTTFLCRDATELLESFLELPPNPLVSTRLVAMLVDPPDGYEGQTQTPFWSLLMQVLEHHADPRGCDSLASLRERYQRLASSPSRPYEGMSAVQAHLLPRIEKRLDALYAMQTELAAAELAHCRRFAERFGQANVAAPIEDQIPALLKQVYAKPGDHPARLVLADALLETGDPRGEFIMLQMRDADGESLTREMRKRHRELLTMYGRTWLGPIEPALQKSGLVYRRGFPVQGRATDYRVPNIEAVLAADEWGTFEELDVSRLRNPGAIVLRPEMSELRRVWGVGADVFETQRELPFESISVRVRGLPSNEILAACESLPHLRHLDVSNAAGRNELEPTRLRALWSGGGFGSRLETLTTTGIGVWLAECVHTELPVERLTMNGAFRMTTGVLTRGADGDLSHLTLDVAGTASVADLRAELSGRLGPVRTVVLQGTGRYRANERRAFERLFRGEPNVQQVELSDGESDDRS